MASLDSCVTHSRITHRYLKDRTTEKREKEETVLQSSLCLNPVSFSTYKMKGCMEYALSDV